MAARDGDGRGALVPAKVRDWQSFQARLRPQLAAFDRLGVRYRIPEVEGLDSDVLSMEPGMQLSLRPPLAKAVIHYTLDGTAPDQRSPVYRDPINLSLTPAGTIVSARPYVGDLAGPISSARFRLAKLEPAANVGPTRPGLKRRYVRGDFGSVDALDRTPPTRTDVASRIAIPSYVHGDAYGLTFDGYLTVPADGIYTFALSADDGSTLWIGGRSIVSTQVPGENLGRIALKAGRHQAALLYFQNGGSAELHLTVSRNGEPPHEIPASWWSHS